MTSDQQWNLAWSKLNALKSNLPSEIDQGHVQEYHDALKLLHEASGQDITPFEIPPDRLRPAIIGVQRRGRSGRGGGVQYHPSKKVCDGNFFHRQLDALYGYFQSLAPNDKQTSEKKYGF